MDIYTTLPKGAALNYNNDSGVVEVWLNNVLVGEYRGDLNDRQGPDTFEELTTIGSGMEINPGDSNV